MLRFRQNPDGPGSNTNKDLSENPIQASEGNAFTHPDWLMCESFGQAPGCSGKVHNRFYKQPTHIRLPLLVPGRTG